MSSQNHIINQQVLEIHMPEDEDVEAVQAAISRLYQEQVVPIINAICEQHSAVGTTCKIDSLSIDLGQLTMGNFEADFVEKFSEQFSEAISAEPLEAPAAARSRGEDGKNLSEDNRRPLDVLAHYLETGSLPWWVTSPSKTELQALLDTLNGSPPPLFKPLLQEIGRKQACIDRFLNTFSPPQIQRSLGILTALPDAELKQTRDEIQSLAKSFPEVFAHSPSAKEVDRAFWAALLSCSALNPTGTKLLAQAIRQTLQLLDADTAALLGKMGARSSAWPGLQAKWGLHQAGATQNAPVSGEGTSQTNQWSTLQTQCRRQLKKLLGQHPQNPWLNSFGDRLLEVLQHPLLHHLPARLGADLLTLLNGLESTQAKASGLPMDILKAVTGANLGPLAQQQQLLEGQLKRITPPVKEKVMERLRSAFDETEFLTVQNAGLVILWPFLSRFFSNLGLLEERTFRDDAARQKAMAMLQHLLGGDEEEVFEGQLFLNKVLCGVNLDLPFEPSQVTEEEAAVAEGLLEAVIARGPHWKNLSLAGFQNSYLKREGLLRSRDGHWLLQVKKETFDITLEKLPWSFSTVKLPWMSEILIVEWT